MAWIVSRAVLYCILIIWVSACSPVESYGPDGTKEKPKAVSLALTAAVPPHVSSRSAGSQSVRFLGSGFAPESRIEINGQPVPAVEVAAQEIRASLGMAAHDWRVGPATVRITNPDGHSIDRDDIFHFGSDTLRFAAPGYKLMDVPIYNAFSIDINADGHRDLVIQSGYTGMSIALWSDSGYLKSRLWGSLISMADDDIDLDGQIDLLGSTYDYGKKIWNIDIAWNDGDGDLHEDPACHVGLDHGNIPVAIGDLDGDGHKDIAAFGDKFIYVCAGQGSRLFSNPAKYPTSIQVNSAITLDIDGDGTSELLVADKVSKQMIVLHLNAPGKLEQLAAFPISTMPTIMKAADLDCDGRADLAYLDDEETRAIGALMNRSRGMRSTSFEFIQINLPTFPKRFVIADVNGDRQLDILTASGQISASNINQMHSIINQPGNCGKFSLRASYAIPSASLLDTGDYDSDGYLDVMIGVTASTLLTEMAGRGDGSFDAPAAISQAGNPLLDDLNRDGMPDLIYVRGVYADGQQIQIQTQLQTQSGAFAVGAPIVLPDSRRSAAAPVVLSRGADWTDIVLATTAADFSSYHLVVVRADTSGQLTQVFRQEMPSEVTGLAIGDLDGDGIAEVLAAAGVGVAVFRQGGRSGLLSGFGMLYTNGSPVDVKIMDRDKGRPTELVVLNYQYMQDASLQIFRDLRSSATRNLAFASKSSVRIPCKVNNSKDRVIIQRADLNADGQDDLVFQHQSCLYLVPHEKGQTWGRPVPVSFPADVRLSGVPVPIEDLNGDGIPDLLVNSQYSATALLGDGAWGFSGVQLEQTWYPNIAMIIADINGDRVNDVVTDTGIVLSRSF